MVPQLSLAEVGLDDRSLTNLPHPLPSYFMKHEGNSSCYCPLVLANDTGLPGVGSVISLGTRSSAWLTISGTHHMSE